MSARRRLAPNVICMSAEDLPIVVNPHRRGSYPRGITYLPAYRRKLARERDRAIGARVAAGIHLGGPTPAPRKAEGLAEQDLQCVEIATRLRKASPEMCDLALRAVRGILSTCGEA